MFFGRNFTKPVNNLNFPVKLYTFTDIIEQNLEYTLNLISTLEDPAVKYKNEDSPPPLSSQNLKPILKTIFLIIRRAKSSGL